MLHKTSGIVLKLIPFKESSVVVQIFTRKFGMQSYLVHGVRKAKAKISLNLFQPLHLLEMVVYHKDHSGLQRISELKHQPAFTQIPFDIQKTSMVLFLHEILCKTIPADFVDEDLFDFIFNAMQWLDVKTEISVNFHLAFLLKLTKYFGFTPSFDREKSHLFFDLYEAKYVSREPVHTHFVSLAYAEVMEQLFSDDFEKLEECFLNVDARRYLLRKILDFYYLHVQTVKDLKSLEVLEQVFS